MADPAVRLPRMSAAEYLELERGSSTRHEFVDGVMYAMSGTTKRHDVIQGNLYATLWNALNPPCIVYSANVKVHVVKDNKERFHYPDTHVVCSDLDTDKLSSSMPVLVVEVASDSTAEYDRGEKFASYRMLPSVQEYLILQQSEPKAELFRKRTDWQVETYGSADSMTLETVRLTLAVAQFYRRVTF
jgi:Uma2 family endonuclease